MKEKLVLVGNGMAGMRTVEELLKIAPDNFVPPRSSTITAIIVLFN